MNKYICNICGFIYDEAEGYLKGNIQPGTKWSDLPNSWVCPLCTAAQSDFTKEETEEIEESITVDSNDLDISLPSKLDYTLGEISAICSNLAKGCEKQYRMEESELFNQIASYFESKIISEETNTFESLSLLIQEDLDTTYALANKLANDNQDRGALRALKWSEQVTRMLSSHLRKYQAEQEAMLESNDVYVCDICGFVYIGDNCPERCPVCKVPSMKLSQVQRGA